MESCPFVHKDLKLVVVPGSRNNHTVGQLSDLDVTTVMQSDKPEKVDVAHIAELSAQIQAWARRMDEQSSVALVIVATLRLEEAQIQMAKNLAGGKDILPIHWLFHPSTEFLAANEPPALAKGILTGKILHGDPEQVKLEDVDPKIVDKLKGLDWLTDSLRVLLANCDRKGFSPRQPVGFLKQNASHNLHWFWKWNIMVPEAKRITGHTNTGWPEALDILAKTNHVLVKLFDEVHQVRHQGEAAKTEDITRLHNITFSIWPAISR